MPQVSAVSTPVSVSGQGVALVPALQQALGREPSIGLAELCLAQLALENDNGKALFNYNPGNLTELPSGTFYVLSQLHTDSQGHAVPAGDPTEVVMRFKNFPDIIAGIVGYVHWVTSRGAFVKAGDAGDARAFAQAIRDSGYTPGINVDAVAKSLALKAHEIDAAGMLSFFSLGGSPVTLSPPPPPVAPPSSLPPNTPPAAAAALSAPAHPVTGLLLMFGAGVAHFIHSNWDRFRRVI